MKKSCTDSDSTCSNPCPFPNTSVHSTRPSMVFKNVAVHVKQFEEIQLFETISPLKIQKNRDIFSVLEDDDVQNWLRIEIKRSQHAIKYRHYLMALPPVYPPPYPSLYPPFHPPSDFYFYFNVFTYFNFSFIVVVFLCIFLVLFLFQVLLINENCLFLIILFNRLIIK